MGYNKEYYLKNKEKIDKRNSEYKTRCNRERMKKILEMKKTIGSCNICGWNEHLEILQFHHRDKEEKSFGIGRTCLSKNWSLVIEEIDKCDLLCPDCHHKIHYNEAVCTNKYTVKRKLKLLELKKSFGKCKKCGDDECIDILQFHHRKKESKKFDVGLQSRGGRWDITLEEVNKCDLLCPNCHSWLHYKETNGGIIEC